MPCKTLMIQGTTSDAGKSVMVAGICRSLTRRGLKVAPFKPQNMALNSAVTVDGGEIGRSQAVQAQACGIEPHTDMNPVLLKPSSDTGAQVIIQGKAVHQMEAASFHDYKKIAMDAVLDSYQRLAAQYDVIVVEGAGSPAEINLRENDIANMGFAEAVDCPVVIVADIDRGGVFAQLVGTLDLLSTTEQNRVTGFIINRFRGDVGLLEPGLDWLENKTRKEVVGVVPYLMNFYLDAEDAISTKVTADIGVEGNNLKKRFSVIAPVFSRISNHTDFDALQLHPDVDFKFIGPGDALPPADLIILPGTKNVRKDLGLLYDYGWDKAIKMHVRYGGKLLGICGGFQMLGEWINDPNGIEDKPGQSMGLGLLSLQTYLHEEKQLKNINGYLQCHGPLKMTIDKACEVMGYEIHCGITEGQNQYPPFMVLDNGQRDGVISDDSLIAGTYIHGLFDQAKASDLILQWAGLESHSSIDLSVVREQQFDRLADCLEDHLSPQFFDQFSS